MTHTLYILYSGIENCADLAERLGDLSREERRGKALFPEYLTQEELLSGIAKGDLKKGTFKVCCMSFESLIYYFIVSNVLP